MSKLVTGHDQYRFLVGTILTIVGFGDLDPNKVAEQQRALEVMEKKKEQTRKHVKKHKEDTHQPDPSSQSATEMIIVPKRNTGDLVDVPQPVPERSASFPVQTLRTQQRFGQQRSGQQPFVQRQVPTGVSRQHSAPVPVVDDPLSTRASSSSSSPPSSQNRPAFHQSAFSNQHQRQIPSNMVPTPPAPPQKTSQPDASDSEGEHRIQMRDFDSQKFSPPLEQMLRMPRPPSGPPETTGLPKATPTVAVSMVDIEEDDNDNEEDDTDDKIGSEFGELSMVDPVALDDNHL